jgi:hypothetical protein
VQASVVAEDNPCARASVVGSRMLVQGPRHAQVLTVRRKREQRQSVNRLDEVLIWGWAQVLGGPTFSKHDRDTACH